MILKLLLTISALLLVSGCISTGTASRGVVVDIFDKPKASPYAIHCEGDKQTMAYVYVGEDLVRGVNNPQKQKIIVQQARKALSDTHVITPVAKRYMEGYDQKQHHMLNINVSAFDVNLTQTQDSAIKKGVFRAQFSIDVAGGGAQCVASEPVLEQITYTMPSYKASQLPSDEAIEQRLVYQAVTKAMSSFVPVKRTILRPIEDGSDAVGQSAGLLDAGNCSLARDILLEYLKKSPNDPKANYNLGVAYECLLKGQSFAKAEDLLENAYKYYRRAVVANPSSEMYNKAFKEVEFQINTFFAVKTKSKEVMEFSTGK